MRRIGAFGSVCLGIIITLVLSISCTGSQVKNETAAAVPAAAPPSTPYGIQFSTPLDDFITSVAVDAEGFCAFTGATEGELGVKNAGRKDVIVGMIDPAGKKLWMTEFGSSSEDGGRNIAFGKDGSVFIAGTASGPLGAKDAEKDSKDMGGQDAFIANVDRSGNVRWIRRIGTPTTDEAFAVCVGGDGSVYAAGATVGSLKAQNRGSKDAFAVKLSPAGDVLWISQWGTENTDAANTIAFAKDGGLFVAGDTSGVMGKEKIGGADIFLSKLDAAGAVAWTRQLGSTLDDHAGAVLEAADGSLYIGGSSAGVWGEKQMGRGDAILLKLTSAAELIWSRQFGTDNWDGIHGMAFTNDPAGGLIVGGCQRWPQCQAFMRRFDAQGAELRKHEIGLSGQGTVCGQKVAVDPAGNAYISGGAQGPLFGEYKGLGNDGFITKVGKDSFK